MNKNLMSLDKNILYSMIKYISGYDISTEEELLKQNIRSVTIISEKNWKPRLIITNYDETQKYIDLDPIEIDNYFTIIRRKKIENLMKKFNEKN